VKTNVGLSITYLGILSEDPLIDIS